MENFYEKYKKLRKDQKIDLADIENRTKINIKYLEAIETGNFDLIQEPYTKLFLRAYINEIGADPDVAISELSDYLLKKDNIKSKGIANANQENSSIDETKRNVLISSKKKKINFRNVSLGINKTTENRRMNISFNLIKGVLFLVFWVIIIIIIRNITLENKTEDQNIRINQLAESTIFFTNFEQLRGDYLEISSQQTAIDQSLPLIVKIVSNKSLGMVYTQDSLEAKPISITAGDQKTFSFKTNLDILLSHSEGVTAFINGNKIQDIRLQQAPVRLIFLIEPKSVTIKHYSKAS